jgi:phosphoribosyl-ATP pyrophosphohydrolase/phosphoribosyl-AMP cyclohydrolase
MMLKLEDVRFDERGLIPAVVQDARTREVLTLAYMNAESLRRTLDEGETWFWSRSRSALWHKGETSGHTQQVVGVRLDCDADALVVLVEPRGPACHTGARSCFHEEFQSAGRGSVEEPGGADSPAEDLGVVVRRLFGVIEERRRVLPEGSYTTYLFTEGLNKILKKVGEESAETIIAAKDGDPALLAEEMADLVYHLLVLLAERGMKLESVGEVLARRASKGGAKDE